MLVKPLLLTLNSCSKFSVDEDKVSHFDPARKAVPVIVAVLSWLHALANEMGLAEPQGKDDYDKLLFIAIPLLVSSTNLIPNLNICRLLF